MAILALLTRFLGLRFREASLFDAEKAQTQAERLGRVNITKGTKGGRGKTVNRWIPISGQVLEVIQGAANIQRQYSPNDQPKNKNLIPANMTFKQWKDHCYYQWHQANQPITKGEQILGFHDMRAAYACERYQHLTGHPAPVVNMPQQRTAPKSLDRQARQILAKELGHGRISVMVHYIGRAR